jgi:hypothetical protein
MMLFYFQGVEYTVDLRTRKCNSSTPRPSFWRPFGVPFDATFFGEGTIGAVGVPNESVTVAIFQGRFEGKGKHRTIYCSLTLLSPIITPGA